MEVNKLRRDLKKGDIMDGGKDKTQWVHGDPRSATHEERVRIGFENLKKKWSEAEATYTDETLTICGHPVMESWEKEYMRDLAHTACKKGGKVLEVGYGMGISAGYIQQQQVEEHIIIEANQEVCERAEAFAKSAPRPVRLLEGFWEDVVSEIPDGSISGILFDTYPLVEDEVHQNHFPFFKEAHRILRPGGVLTYYSDEISQFSEQHMACLRKAGFIKISGRVCRVTPPSDCKYWQSKTILVPVVIK